MNRCGAGGRRGHRQSGLGNNPPGRVKGALGTSLEAGVRSPLETDREEAGQGSRGQRCMAVVAKHEREKRRSEKSGDQVDRKRKGIDRPESGKIDTRPWADRKKCRG